MNTHLSAHFPLIPVVAAGIGIALMVITSKEPWREVGKTLLWGGTFAALFASSGSC